MEEKEASALRDRYQAVCSNIARAARQAGRPESSVQLVVASKTQSVEAIEELLKAGHRLFGENRVQEACEKWPELKARYPDIRLHLIGPLQTNKVKEAVELFDVIETIDRDRLAVALAKEQAKQGRKLTYFLEVNVGAEDQKAGTPVASAPELHRSCVRDLGLSVTGLMCIPPAGQQASPYFALLAKLASSLNLPELSMGMTADYPLAIELGATYVRVGTAIFGDRK